MIVLTGITKSYRTRSGPHRVLDGIDFTVMPGEKVGILGHNGSGKSTLIRIMSGAERPSDGEIARTMSNSWPLAFAGAFQGRLSGLDNIKFICRVYGVDYRDRVAYIEDFTELGKFLWEPLHSYSSGMRARLAFAISMAIEFDCFLIDEVIAVGDARFHEKCRRELFEKRADRAMVMVSHDPYNIREHCSRACVLRNGRLNEFSTVEEAYDNYQSN